jgi:hypothetical protein
LINAPIVIPLATDNRTLFPRWEFAATLFPRWEFAATFFFGEAGMCEALNQTIEELIAGDDWIFKRTLKNAPAGTDIAQVVVTFKRDVADADPGNVQVTITQALTTSGQITAAGSSGTVQFWFQVPHATTKILSGWYQYDIQVKTSAGRLHTVEAGNALVKAQITQAE